MRKKISVAIKVPPYFSPREFYFIFQFSFCFSISLFLLAWLYRTRKPRLYSPSHQNQFLDMRMSYFLDMVRKINIEGIATFYEGRNTRRLLTSVVLILNNDVISFYRYLHEIVSFCFGRNSRLKGIYKTGSKIKLFLYFLK